MNSICSVYEVHNVQNIRLNILFEKFFFLSNQDKIGIYRTNLAVAGGAGNSPELVRQPSPPDLDSVQ